MGNSVAGRPSGVSLVKLSLNITTNAGESWGMELDGHNGKHSGNRKGIEELLARWPAWAIQALHDATAAA
jgi:hypothetical protein